MPVPIQLCVQGGAAKIALLTAFMEAVEGLHEAGKLRVTNVAGTSAGAIVGTLFAAGVPMSTVRNRLGAVDLTGIVPRKGWLRTGSDLARGLPLWNEDGLRDFLKALLAESPLVKEEKPPKELQTFADIFKHRAIRTQVMATNLVDGMTAIKGAGEPIVNSLLDSAALPFFFRANSSKNGTVVDGGLCENLPIDLLSDSETDGPIVAISFLRKAGAPPANLLEYCLAVVGAGVDHSADRAKRLLEERAQRLSLPHKVYPIDSPIESLDFEKAVRDGLGPVYEQVRKDAKEWLTKFVEEREQQIQAQIVAGQRASAQAAATVHEDDYYKLDMPYNLAQLYKTQHQPFTLRWSYARLEVTVSPDHDHPDTLKHRAQFHTRDQPVWCHRLPVLVAPQSSSSKEPGWTIFGPDEKIIPYYHMLMNEKRDPKTLEWLICFYEPLPVDSGPYTLVFVDYVHDFMKPLRNSGRDEIWVSFQRKHGLVDKVEVIAHVPFSMPKVKLEPMAGARESALFERFELDEIRQAGHDPYAFRGAGVSADRWGMYLKSIK